VKSTKEILTKLKSLKNPKNIEGMKRFAVGGKNTLGVSIPILRSMAKELKNHSKTNPKDPNKNEILSKAQNDMHRLALELFASGIHEARILASMIDEPSLVTEKQMDDWTYDFDSWDVCDQVCMNLFDKTKFAYDKVFEYSKKEREFEKRTAFTLIACLAWHDKTMPDEKFIKFLPIIKRESTDKRNFVKKAVNWALRHIGKRNLKLRLEALKLADEIKKLNNKTAIWVANDTIRELNNPKIVKRIKAK
jgi:3-methyladenine DNA glycosylase AlkD